MKPSGKDAADIKPKFVPADKLRPRDNSGGEGYSPRAAEFGDAGKTTGSKSHLSA